MALAAQLSALGKLVERAAAGGLVQNEGSALISGVLDGYLVANDHATIWVLKNVALAAAGAAGMPIPRGAYLHSVGQLGMFAVLILKK